MAMTSLPPLSNGLLLSSSSDPLTPIELRLASLPSYPCTAIVSPISQSPSLYPITHPANPITTISSSPLSFHAPPSTYTPQLSLPGLIDQLSGPELIKWREEHWPDGLNAGACGVSPSFRLGGPGGPERNPSNKDITDIWRNNSETKLTCIEPHQRPKYIIHTHAPNFADKSYSTPLVKQLLVNCYRGALVEAMRISEKEEELRRVDEEARFANVMGAEMEIEMEVEISPDKIHGAHRGDRLGYKAVRGTETDSDPSGISAPIANTTQTQLPNKNTPSNPSSQTTSSSPSSNLIPNPTSPTPASVTKHTQGITLAFPALATGSKCFPHRLAARIAVATVRDFLKHPVFGGERRRRIRRVVFCVWPVGSPNRKALQIAFGIVFPPPLPQSAPLSPVSNQLVTPPFSPSSRGKTGGGLVVREVEEVEKSIIGAGDLGGKIAVVEGQGDGVETETGVQEGGLEANEAGNENDVKIVGDGVVKGRIKKDSYKQTKRKQGLRLAALNRERRERKAFRGLGNGDQGQGQGQGQDDSQGIGDGKSGSVNCSVVVRLGEMDTEMLEGGLGVGDKDADGDHVL
ncbi:hypothetical protein EYC80_009527 [Monilinia laxa]|uniref:ADP-ribose 1''-phosphate phosphatase n=1 Tax=Monilinia laxa TaxID=61186 RepID=A0A5N6JY40_MONLA|nr:hypothetical protein EYC80_009527 [Monilinia laxa]